MIYAVDLFQTKCTESRPWHARAKKLTQRPVFFTDLSRPRSIDELGFAALHGKRQGREGAFRMADSFRVYVLQPDARGTSAKWELIMAGTL